MNQLSSTDLYLGRPYRSIRMGLSHIGRLFFSQALSSDVHFGAVSMIHSALQRNAATHHKVLAPFSFNHMIDSLLE